MADVIFCRSRNSTCYWLVGESDAGKKFITHWFNTVPGYIMLIELETYIARAEEADLTVEVSG